MMCRFTSANKGDGTMDAEQLRGYLEVHCKLLFNRARVLSEGSQPVPEALLHYTRDIGHFAGEVFHDLDGRESNTFIDHLRELRARLEKLRSCLPSCGRSEISGKAAIVREIRRLSTDVNNFHIYANIQLGQLPQPPEGAKTHE